jgi:hypothetical protein
VVLRRSLQLIGAFLGLFSVLSAATFPEPDPFGQVDLWHRPADPLTLAGSGSPSESTATLIELWIVATSVACLIVGTWLADRAVHGLAIVGLLVSVGVLVGDLVGGSQGGSIAAVGRGGRPALGGDPRDPLLGAGRFPSADEPSGHAGAALAIERRLHPSVRALPVQGIRRSGTKLIP